MNQVNSTQKLLSRDEFRNGVFKRDNHMCIICQKPAVDAHHILERRLFPDGGYYLDNGASLCEVHHLEAEMTTLSAQTIREKLNIKHPLLPPHLYSDQEYDKWGNILLPNGHRLMGEMFHDESVQKILERGEVLNLFLKYIKYPRTFHLPWSMTKSKDDRVLANCDQFKGKEVVVTLKFDGENTSMYNDYIHARSINSGNHESRNFVKRTHSQIMGDIPENWRICGENVYAKHSIHYKNLDSYFYIFSIWNNQNMCLSWDETKEYSQLFELPTVPVLYEGVFDEKIIKSLAKPLFEGNEMEGYVVRLKDSFIYKDFQKSMAKYVRENHVTTHGHWMRQMVIPNLLKVNQK